MTKIFKVWRFPPDINAPSYFALKENYENGLQLIYTDERGCRLKTILTLDQRGLTLHGNLPDWIGVPVDQDGQIKIVNDGE